ncbi:hypothetical protein KY363_06475, partial [Candidatus Woesearchaeota archaeon]|nr:hypothetical protein [Candidatus Woesearchaeota archaeon]
MVDFTRIPASLITTGKFPKLSELPDGVSKPKLPTETRRVSSLIDYLFTKTPEGNAKDHDCLIEG